MDIRTELMIIAVVCLPIVAVRVGIGLLQRRLRIFATALSLASVIALVASFRAPREVYQYAMLLSVGMVFGTIDAWRAVWKQRAGKPWTRA